MGFTVAFNLGNLVHGLPARAQASVNCIYLGTAISLLRRKHQTVAQIAIVRNGQNLAACFGFISLKVAP